MSPVPIALANLQEWEDAFNGMPLDELAEIRRLLAFEEMRNENPFCGSMFFHVTDTLVSKSFDGAVYNLQMKSAGLHHKAVPQTCKLDSHYRCWRAAAREILHRVDETIDALVAEGTLFFVRIPGPETADGVTLASRLEG